MLDTIAGMTPTGRKVDGPTADLVELSPKDGPLHTAIVLEEAFRDLPELATAIDLALGFMSFPMVAGLVEMTVYARDEGALCYATGTSRSIAEIIKAHRDAGKTVGKRAAMELCYLAGMVLAEAAETGALQGVFSHGDLSPWRLLVRPDGQVQVIGYGLPSPEVLQFHAGKAKQTLADTWRYAPPERVLGMGEDLHSDLLSLGLVAFEMITGEPLLDGDDAAIRQALEKGELPQRVAKHGRALGKDIADLLGYAMNFDPRNRFDSGDAFVDAVEKLLEAGIAGDTLAEAAAKVHSQRRGTSLTAVDDTMVVSRASGRAIRPRGARAVQEALNAPVKDDDRWSSRKRRDREDVAAATEAESARPRRQAAPAEPEQASERPRRRTRAAEADGTKDDTPKRPRRRSSATKDDATAEDAPKRPRRRTRATAEDDAEAEGTKRPRRRTRAPSSEADDAEAPKRPRRRTRATDEDSTEEEAPMRPRRRKRSEE